jgi:hypothetical protein
MFSTICSYANDYKKRCRMLPVWALADTMSYLGTRLSKDLVKILYSVSNTPLFNKKGGQGEFEVKETFSCRGFRGVP